MLDCNLINFGLDLDHLRYLIEIHDPALVVTCNVLEVGDYGVKVRIGEGGPVSTIKKSELALRKSENRPDRFAKNDRFDAMLTSLDLTSYKVSLSIRALEEADQKEALEKFGNVDSGSSLGDILGKALGREPKK